MLVSGSVVATILGEYFWNLFQASNKRIQGLLLKVEGFFSENTLAITSDAKFLAIARS